MLWADSVCLAARFHPYSRNIRLQKDNSAAEIFTTKLQKDKLNPVVKFKMIM